MNRPIRYLLTPIILIFSLYIEAVSAEPSSNDVTELDKKGTVSCIPINRIRHIEVLDNQTILFHMLGDEVWENRLPYPCVGLKFEGGIEYKTGISKLCDKDIITIIRLGTPCSLGKFRPCEEEKRNCADTFKEK